MEDTGAVEGGDIYRYLSIPKPPSLAIFNRKDTKKKNLQQTHSYKIQETYITSYDGDSKGQFRIAYYATYTKWSTCMLRTYTDAIFVCCSVEALDMINRLVLASASSQYYTCRHLASSGGSVFLSLILPPALTPETQHRLYHRQNSQPIPSISHLHALSPAIRINGIPSLWSSRWPFSKRCL